MPAPSGLSLIGSGRPAYDRIQRWPHHLGSMAAGSVYHADERFVSLISTNVVEQDRCGRLRLGHARHMRCYRHPRVRPQRMFGRERLGFSDIKDGPA